MVRWAVAVGGALGLAAQIGCTAPKRADTTRPRSTTDAGAVRRAACSPPQLMDFDLADPEPLPRGSDVTSASLRQDQAELVTLDELRRLLDKAKPLARCDPSIQDWQYGPWADGSFTTKRGATYTVQLFLGGRGIVTLPDGRRIMFDAGG